jgi:hypothetical protein
MTQGPLPLVLLATKLHPEIKFRQHLWSVLDSWLELQSPRFADEFIEIRLKEENGSFLEPFQLCEEDTRIAVFLIRLALSKKSPASRFRIASSDAIGGSGGLVITRSGASFYSERHALGRNHLVNSDIRFFAPDVLVSSPLRKQKKEIFSARLRSDENGLYLDLPAGPMQRIGWISENSEHSFKSLATTLFKMSVIGPKLLPLSSLNVEISASDDGLCIAVTKPEALIRFSGYVVQGDLIQLKANNRFEIAVELPRSAEGPAPITIVAEDSFAAHWMNVEGLGAPDLEPADIAEITDWAFHHVHWINSLPRNV